MSICISPLDKRGTPETKTAKFKSRAFTMQVTIPPLKNLTDGATMEDRHKMHKEYIDDLMRANPGRFNEDGTLKTTWQALKDLFKRGPNMDKFINL